eukprot:6207961-Karenia_brevis.AAC.1
MPLRRACVPSCLAPFMSNSAACSRMQAKNCAADFSNMRVRPSDIDFITHSFNQWNEQKSLPEVEQQHERLNTHADLRCFLDAK